MDAGLPLAISHGDMDHACDRGEARPFASSMPWLARYREAWWVVCDLGWLRICDELDWLADGRVGR